jgi:hypothetical protein
MMMMMMMIAKLEGKSHLADLLIDGRIILKCLKEIRWEGEEWNNLAWDRDKRQTVTNLINEFTGSIKCREFFDCLRTVSLS